MEEKRFTPDIIARAEELLCHLQGVHSARITTDETGEITEVHVMAEPTKSAKMVVRDVETCLRAELGIYVDHRKIGVAFYNREEQAQEERSVAEDRARAEIVELPIEEYPSRFAFRSVNLFMSEEEMRAEVELSREGKEAFGSARSDSLSRSPRDLIAEATLKAVSEFLDEKLRLCLFQVLEVPLGDERAMIVRVDLVRDRDKKSLAGCCMVTDDVNQSVVFATLDAVNRILGKLKAKGSVEYKIE